MRDIILTAKTFKSSKSLLIDLYPSTMTTISTMTKLNHPILISIYVIIQPLVIDKLSSIIIIQLIH